MELAFFDTQTVIVLGWNHTPDVSTGIVHSQPFVTSVYIGKPARLVFQPCKTCFVPNLNWIVSVMTSCHVICIQQHLVCVGAWTALSTSNDISYRSQEGYTAWIAHYQRLKHNPTISRFFTDIEWGGYTFKCLWTAHKHFDMMNVVQHLTLKYYHIFRFNPLRTHQHKGWHI